MIIDPYKYMKSRSEKILILTFIFLGLIFISYNWWSRNQIKTIENRAPLKQLRVQNNQLIDEDGEKIILRGVAIEDPNYPYSRGIREEDFKELVYNWKVNVIKIPIHPGIWQQAQSQVINNLDKVINLAEKYRVYIIISWNAQGNPITKKTIEASLPFPLKGNPYNPDIELAKDFWSKISSRYKDKPFILYSIFSEPAFISWSEYKIVAEDLIDVIRKENSQALILVSGTEWGYDLSLVLDNPIKRENIIYETHVYPGKGKSYEVWERYFGYLSNKYPVFVGEWGFQRNSEDKNLDGTIEDFGQPFLDYLEQKQFSWTAWVWSKDWKPPMLINWNYQTTEFGEFVKEALEKYQKF